MYEPSSVDPLTLPSLPLEWSKGLPECPGIYFAIDSQGTVQYIGRSNNIQHRWLQHHRKRQLEQIGGVKIAWIEVSDKTLLPVIEKALIDWFDPPLNRRFAVVRCNTNDKESPPLVTKVLWKLREVMKQRGITNKAIADELNVHPTTISRLKTQDVLPEIGSETLCQLINAIN
ncbi:GIY-YIG nuclease family protein [Scytonema sp. UIC 10036]|uniref:GIY-YIG nuclease family protein n=1 Tax=Scytonema sp. UIC 10036 TaxID=2304196 RepID=UPI001FAA3E4C|nr:GIY-YIG nuclease family protein [Scytonema sp. UIC 10036]